MRLRRSELSTPGSDERKMAKAAASDADLVFLDLEDAVAPAQKVSARDKVATALTDLDWGVKTRAVRINGVHTEYAHDDVIRLMEQAGTHLDVIIVPKVRAARDVWWVDTLLTQLEAKLRLTRRIALEVLIEEVEAMVEVDEIARCCDRVEALIFGPGDYAASQGVDVAVFEAEGIPYPGDIWHYARNRIAVAARSAGLAVIDGPCAALGDLEGFRREAVHARLFGAEGKWAIHPDQIALANDVFSPRPEDVDRSQRLLHAYEQAEAAGLGAVAVDGTMVDAASARSCRSTLARARQVGM